MVSDWLVLLDMGDYGPYVWSSVGICAFAFIGIYWYARNQLHRALREERQILKQRRHHDTE